MSSPAEEVKKTRKRGFQYSIRHVNRIINQEKKKYKKQLKVRQESWLKNQRNLPSTSQAISTPPDPLLLLTSSSLSSSVPRAPDFNTANDNQHTEISDKLVEAIIKKPVDAVDCRVPQNTYTKLLHILKQDLDLPISIDARTVLKTKEVVPYEARHMFPGYYYHFGLKQSIISVLDRFNFTPLGELQIEINVDGLPLAKSSGSQFWPILCNIENLNNDFVFPVGVYHGFSKPVDPNEFLKYVADDFFQISSQGFKYKNKDIQVRITKVLCDAPAKAFILNIKSHNAYFGCTKCSTEGSFVNNRMTYEGFKAKVV
ncbi:unnamed protein product [Ceutorhynchus assimilis]|uniref:Uncharacterized protein n=1 Tax=Ceutorhynchus assimilis TaxID=467358 RepID=A0A9N9MKC1_9CUCU|nr:unnamed protein product [Ceutorhynchus assimilis]